MNMMVSMMKCPSLPYQRNHTTYNIWTDGNRQRRRRKKRYPMFLRLDGFFILLMQVWVHLVVLVCSFGLEFICKIGSVGWLCVVCSSVRLLARLLMPLKSTPFFKNSSL